MLQYQEDKIQIAVETIKSNYERLSASQVKELRQALVLWNFTDEEFEE